MNIGMNAGVAAATTAADASNGGSVQTAVLGAVLGLQAQDGAALVNAIPPAAPLAASGSVGTQVNTYA